MSKRDTIIIAVLVNAGLLLVLFATAMRSKDKSEEQKEVIAEAPVATVSPNEMQPLAQGEEKNLPANSQNGTLLDLQIPQDLALTENLVENQSETLLFSEELETKEPNLEVVPKEAAPAVVQAPSKPAPKITKLEPTVVTVTVKKGDFLERIAKTHESTVALIMKANNLTSTQLKIGQVLKVPVKEKASARDEVVKASSKAEEFYIVKEGDSPWLIASRNHIKLDELMRLNGMDEQKARRLRPGDRLRIR